jgi:hypothetical protein
MTDHRKSKKPGFTSISKPAAIRRISETLVEVIRTTGAWTNPDCGNFQNE